MRILSWWTTAVGYFVETALYKLLSSSSSSSSLVLLLLLKLLQALAMPNCSQINFRKSQQNSKLVALACLLRKL